MSSTSTRRAVILVSAVGLAALGLGACGGSSVDSPVAPVLTGEDGGIFTTLGNGPGNGGEVVGPGDGTCDGSGDGTCDGTSSGPGTQGGQGSGSGHGPGDGSCNGTCGGPHGGQGSGPGDGTCDGNGHGPGDGSCDGDCDGAGYGPGDGTCDGAGYGPGDGSCDGDCDGAGPDPDDLETLLVEALQEEHLAEQTYRRVLADFGNVMPFAAIADSEQQHVQAIVGLFTRRGWTPPASIWTPDNVSAFESLSAACTGGVAIEIEDGALYDGYLSRDDLPRDAVNVFTNLRWASLERHLPAFQACQ